MFGDPVFEVTEGYGIDSIAFSNNIIICGQSRKEVSCHNDYPFCNIESCVIVVCVCLPVCLNAHIGKYMGRKTDSHVHRHFGLY